MHGPMGILGAQLNAYHASALNNQHGNKTVVVVDDDAYIEPHHHNRTISESTTTTKELTKGQSTYRKTYGTFSLLRSIPALSARCHAESSREP
jgi:hypothetical protein